VYVYLSARICATDSSDLGFKITQRYVSDLGLL